MFEEHQRAIEAMRRADRALTAALESALRPFGITAAQLGALTHLNRDPSASMAELARLASVTPQTMHRVVVGLERRGFVQRRQLDGDRKKLEVAVTASGTAVLHAADEALRHEQESIFEEFADDELSKLVDLLSRFERIPSALARER